MLWEWTLLQKLLNLPKEDCLLIFFRITWDNCPFNPESFDVMVLLAVLEHVFEPLTMMKQVESFLKPGGTVIFSTPNLDNLPYLLMENKADYSWFIKEHINQFTMKTHRTLLKKAGFHNVTFHNCGHFIVEETGNDTNLLAGESFLKVVRDSLLPIIEGLSKQVYSKTATDLSDAEIAELVGIQFMAWNIKQGEYSITHTILGRAFKKAVGG